MSSFLNKIKNPLNGSLQKEASAVEEREERLSNSSNEDFAVVVYDGNEMYKKFPVKTAEDVSLSEDALSRSRATLPDEVVDVASAYIKLAKRQHGEEVDIEKESIPSSNIVYTGNISKRAFNEKLFAEKEAQAKEAQVGDSEFSPFDKESFREVERHFEIGLEERQEKIALLGQEMIKRAEHLGIDIKSNELSRYDRNDLPASFKDSIEQRKIVADEKVASYYDDLLDEANAGHVGLTEAVECIRRLDKHANIKMKGGMSKLGKSHKTPIDVVFPKEEELALERDFEKAASVFGADLVNSYKSDPSVISQLSDSEEKLFKSLING